MDARRDHRPDTRLRRQLRGVRAAPQHRRDNGHRPHRAEIPDRERSHLVIAHLSAILQGAMYLGLSVAFAMANLTPWLETSAAALLVCGSVLFVTGATLNWRQDVGDHFAERSPGWRCFALSSVGHLSGMTLVLVGVVMGI